MCEGDFRTKVLNANKLACEPFYHKKPDISLNETNDTNHSTVEDENSLEFTIFAPNCDYLTRVRAAGTLRVMIIQILYFDVFNFINALGSLSCAVTTCAVVNSASFFPPLELL